MKNGHQSSEEHNRLDESKDKPWSPAYVALGALEELPELHVKAINETAKPILLVSDLEDAFQRYLFHFE